MTTLPNSLKSGRTNAPADCTASLIALIPVFIECSILQSDGHENQKMRSNGAAVLPSLAFCTAVALSHDPSTAVRHIPDGSQEQVKRGNFEIRYPSRVDGRLQLVSPTLIRPDLRPIRRSNKPGQQSVSSYRVGGD